MAPARFQIQIEKCHFESKTLVIVCFTLSPKINVGTVVMPHQFELVVNRVREQQHPATARCRF
jgi:hypothetical protein